jgi:carboxyl-terminal processing protease
LRPGRAFAHYRIGVVIFRAMATTFRVVSGAIAPMLLILAGASNPAPDAGTAAPKSTLAEVRSLVSANFYSPALLKRLGWDDAPTEAPPPSEERARIQALLAKLHTSHTAYYAPEDPEYWQLLSIFELACGDGAHAAAAPVQVEGIGVYWKQIETRWFVVGVFPEGPAARAGLLAGDEVQVADGRPFSPVLAFKDKAGKQVALRVRRRTGAEALDVAVTPRWARPQVEFQEAMVKGARVISTSRHRIGYVRVWSWGGDEMQAALVNAIVDLNRQHVDSWILDLRDGIGGANPEFESVFSQDIVGLATIDRHGSQTLRDTQLRGPTVVLINRGTRSGKEIVAFAAKRAKAATLVGEQTAGAALAGRPFCLSNGSLLYLAVADISVGGERLEGRGVAPDVFLPFDVRYSAGEDLQLAKAIDLLGGRAN